MVKVFVYYLINDVGVYVQLVFQDRSIDLLEIGVIFQVVGVVYILYIGVVVQEVIVVQAGAKEQQGCCCIVVGFIGSILFNVVAKF